VNKTKMAREMLNLSGHSESYKEESNAWLNPISNDSSGHESIRNNRNNIRVDNESQPSEL
jgi:hypothetical protein